VRYLHYMSNKSLLIIIAKIKSTVITIIMLSLELYIVLIYYPPCTILSPFPHICSSMQGKKICNFFTSFSIPKGLTQSTQHCTSAAFSCNCFEFPYFDIPTIQLSSTSNNNNYYLFLF
jgi:hypothetical protein